MTTNPEWEGRPAPTLPILPPSLSDLSRPPMPVPGCVVCLRPAERRGVARAECDRSAEADANVLLRRHLRKEHGA
ncbi:hypothetical protein [Streptomyces sp. WELS2]|uniref:hypothetical protein n=1 Tax=Streptomyces sp. WELS2 TaxID=2749435 RepID=UPI0015F04D88|nr:hypothetical protein [Streptomyces sp. WELS2]